MPGALGAAEKGSADLDAARAIGAVLAAVGEGRIKPSEAGEITALIEACRKKVAPPDPPARVFQVSFRSA